MDQSAELKNESHGGPQVQHVGEGEYDNILSSPSVHNNTQIDNSTEKTRVYENHKFVEET